MTPLLEAIFALYESEVYKIMAIQQDTIQRCVEALGPEKFLAVIDKQKLLAALSKEDLLAALSKEDLLAALSQEDILSGELFARLNPSQLQQLLVKISRQQSESH